jgi:hypothetical protein
MYKNMETKIKDRIKSRVVEVGECWEWLGRFSSKSPQIRHKGRAVSLRRLLWIERAGRNPDDKYIHVSCGNWRCVNPDHLVAKDFKGHAVATAGKRSKASYKAAAIKVGKKNRKLTVQQVMEIRASSKSCKKLGEEYGVSHTTVNKIKRGLIYNETSIWSQLMR